MKAIKSIVYHIAGEKTAFPNHDTLRNTGITQCNFKVFFFILAKHLMLFCPSVFQCEMLVILYNLKERNYEQ